MSTPYVLDSSAIIDLHQHFSKTRLRKAFTQISAKDHLRIPEGVFREIRRKTDDAKTTLEQLEKKTPALVVKMSRVHNLLSELSRMEQTYGEEIRVGTKPYPGFWHSASGRKAGDGQVVATAKKLEVRSYPTTDAFGQPACWKTSPALAGPNSRGF
ncbi:MAG: hypothetical protein KatS3mg082_2006 [Nitrospiraceae bacterium]|nr:MAG: hypothetical protein KatS3mg082_2006 [Nitrospiraceae bacterium]